MHSSLHTTHALRAVGGAMRVLVHHTHAITGTVLGDGCVFGLYFFKGQTSIHGNLYLDKEETGSVLRESEFQVTEESEVRHPTTPPHTTPHHTTLHLTPPHPTPHHTTPHHTTPHHTTPHHTPPRPLPHTAMHHISPHVSRLPNQLLGLPLCHK